MGNIGSKTHSNLLTFIVVIFLYFLIISRSNCGFVAVLNVGVDPEPFAVRFPATLDQNAVRRLLHDILIHIFLLHQFAALWRDRQEGHVAFAERGHLVPDSKVSTLRQPCYCQAKPPTSRHPDENERLHQPWLEHNSRFHQSGGCSSSGANGTTSAGGANGTTGAGGAAGAAGAAGSVGTGWTAGVWSSLLNSMTSSCSSAWKRRSPGGGGTSSFRLFRGEPSSGFLDQLRKAGWKRTSEKQFLLALASVYAGEALFQRQPLSVQEKTPSLPFPEAAPLLDLSTLGIFASGQLVAPFECWSK